MKYGRGGYIDKQKRVGSDCYLSHGFRANQGYIAHSWVAYLIQVCCLNVAAQLNCIMCQSLEVWAEGVELYLDSRGLLREVVQSFGIWFRSSYGIEVEIKYIAACLVCLICIYYISLEVAKVLWVWGQETSLLFGNCLHTENQIGQCQLASLPGLQSQIKPCRCD